MSPSIPKISIGVPVYNGEKFIAARLDSIIQQTFENFEIILSDNASTDSTEEICKKYIKSDKRIKYYRQNENQGLFLNYKFVLENSIGEYFVIANVDDLWEKTFLEKNLHVLENNPNVVVSSGKIVRFGGIENEFIEKNNDTKLNLTYKKFRRTFRSLNIYPMNGDFYSKTRFCLRKYNFWIQFGLYRREKLQQSMFKKPFYGWDYALVINTLRYGDVFVLDENLMKFYSKGASGSGVIEFLKQQNLSKFNLILPHFTFTNWCRKNLGTLFVVKNIDYFIRLNFLSIISVIQNISQKK